MPDRRGGHPADAAIVTDSAIAPQGWVSLSTVTTVTYMVGALTANATANHGLATASDITPREVQEEMGTTVGVDVLRFVAPVRYGFLAPGGAPRLKTIFLYLLRPGCDDLKPGRLGRRRANL